MEGLAGNWNVRRDIKSVDLSINYLAVVAKPIQVAGVLVFIDFIKGGL
jgi:hypothetical protein